MNILNVHTIHDWCAYGRVAFTSTLRYQVVEGTLYCSHARMLPTWLFTIFIESLRHGKIFLLNFKISHSSSFGTGSTFERARAGARALPTFVLNVFGGVIQTTSNFMIILWMMKYAQVNCTTVLAQAHFDYF